MPHPHLHTARGQVMIISLIVLGFMTLSFVLIGATTLNEDEQVNLVLEQKALANAAANGCMEQAMERLGLNSLYVGNETLTVASSTCLVRPVISGVGTWTLETWATSSEQYARQRAVLTSRLPIVISSWVEVAGF